MTTINTTSGLTQAHAQALATAAIYFHRKNELEIFNRIEKLADRLERISASHSCLRCSYACGQILILDEEKPVQGKPQKVLKVVFDVISCARMSRFESVDAEIEVENNFFFACGFEEQAAEPS